MHAAPSPFGKGHIRVFCIIWRIMQNTILDVLHNTPDYAKQLTFWDFYIIQDVYEQMEYKTST